MYRKHVNCEKKGTAALLIFTAKNDTAYKLLANHKAAVISNAAADNAAARMVNLMHVDVRPVPSSCMRQLEILDGHFNPQNELLGSVRYEKLLNMVLDKNETLAQMMVRLQDAIHQVDAVRPHNLSLSENRSHLERMLLKSSEQVIQNFASSMQMSQPNMTWSEITNLEGRFDHSTLGIRRLAKKDTILALEGEPSPDHGKRKPCQTCGKVGHTTAKCWTAHPEMMPEFLKKRGKKRAGEEKPPPFKFSKLNDKGDTISMLDLDVVEEENHDGTDYGVVKINAVSLVISSEDEGINSDFRHDHDVDTEWMLHLDEEEGAQPTILFDSGASKTLFIMTDVSFLERAK